MKFTAADLARITENIAKHRSVGTWLFMDPTVLEALFNRLLAAEKIIDASPKMPETEFYVKAWKMAKGE